MSFHPRISVNSISSMQQSFDEDMAMWADLGVDHVGLIEPKLRGPGYDECAKAILDAGLRVSSMSSYFDGIAESLEFSAAIGCPVLYIVSGTAGGLLWEDAAEQFCADVAAHVARGKELGVRMAIEPTNPLRSDVSFVHTVLDAAHLARKADIGIVFDFYSAWYERDIDQRFRDNLDLVTLVQIDDYKFGSFDVPNRVAIGDGDVPVERLLAMVLDAGYEGPFDLELLGPQIEAERETAGYRAPIERSLERASEILSRLGA